MLRKSLTFRFQESSTAHGFDLISIEVFLGGVFLTWQLVIGHDVGHSACLLNVFSVFELDLLLGTNLVALCNFRDRAGADDVLSADSHIEPSCTLHSPRFGSATAHVIGV